jgi:hypothetical protein
MKKVYTDIDAALQLAEPADIRIPMEKPKMVALRILAKYNELFGGPDMRIVSRVNDVGVATLLTHAYHSYGQLSSFQFN